MKKARLDSNVIHFHYREMLDNERLLNDVGVSPLECGSTSMPQIPKGGLLVRVSVVIKNDNYYQVFDYVSGFNRRYYSHRPFLT
jgi:hypothetical protein